VGDTVARSDIAVYQPDEGTRLELRLQGETVWATEVRIGELFGVDRSVIYRHIRNIYRTGELEEAATCAKVAQVQMEGRRTVTRQIPYYNLDVIIAVGYRVNSLRATRFRIWATRVLREMLLSRCDEIRRLDKLEHRVGDAEREISQVKSGMNYLIKQITTPPKPPKRRPIGFHVKYD